MYRNLVPSLLLCVAPADVTIAAWAVVVAAAPSDGLASGVCEESKDVELSSEEESPPPPPPPAGTPIHEP